MSMLLRMPIRRIAWLMASSPVASELHLRGGERTFQITAVL